MSARFQFPCPHCESKFELVTKQAGQTLTCQQCNKTCEAPKLGTLRNLEPVGGAAPTASSDSSWGGRKSLLFVFGLGLAILAGTAGYFLYQNASSRYTEFDLEKGLAQLDSDIDGFTPAMVMRKYQSLRVEDGLGDWVEQPRVGENKQAEILMNFSYGLFGLAGIGLLLLIIGLVIPK